MPIEVIDLFCGVGGLTRGLIDSGLNVLAGFDNDETCRFAYEENNHIPFHNANIRDMNGNEIIECYQPNSTRVLVGCAPCQPFSTMRFKYKHKNTIDDKYNLLNEFGRMIEIVNPTIVSMENVPQIQQTHVYDNFITLLRRLGYSIFNTVVFCPDYGISQSRRRFVLLASLLGEINLIPATHNRNDVQVQNFIRGLPQIDAGQIDDNDPLHRSANLSDINHERIIHSVPGGTWRDWPVELRCPCHKRETGQTYSSVYARMRWNQIGPTITTQFYSYGTGRYGHPEQDRALSLREGALLQTFPPNYNFINPNRDFSLRDVARHIGNAVPVRLGEVIGISIQNHLNYHGIE